MASPPNPNIADIAEIVLKIMVLLDHSAFLPCYKDGPLSNSHFVVVGERLKHNGVLGEDLGRVVLGFKG